jgi:hypothetical protein
MLSHLIFVCTYRKLSNTTLRAKESAAFIHEAEDLVVFSPRLYKERIV